MGLASFSCSAPVRLQARRAPRRDRRAIDVVLSCPYGVAGAGEGNRTLVVSLEGFCSTIELHPPDELICVFLPFSAPSSCLWRHTGKSWWRRLDSNQRRRKPTDLQSAPFNHSGTPPRRTANYGLVTTGCQTTREACRSAAVAGSAPGPKRVVRWRIGSAGRPARLPWAPTGRCGADGMAGTHARCERQLT